MQKYKKTAKSKNAISNAIDDIINSESKEKLLYNNNKFICMILSPLMFIFAIATFFINYYEATIPIYVMVM